MYNSNDFSKTKQAWKLLAHKLAKWAQDTLVYRSDDYGRYRPNPFRAKRPLNFNNLYDHFCCRETIGIYCLDTDDKGKWCCIDIDSHGEPLPQHWSYAAHLAGKLTSLGLEYILEASSGNHSYHIWIPFTEPVPAPILRRLGLWLTTDHEERGIKQPEVFPKQDTIHGKWGNFVRLPGKHHKHEWVSEFFDITSGTTGQWHKREDAPKFLLTKTGNSPERIPSEVAAYQPPTSGAALEVGEVTPTDSEWKSRYKGNLCTLDIVAYTGQAGLQPSQVGIDRYKILCPWREGHTKGSNENAYVWATEGRTPTFFCHHDTCSGRKIEHLLGAFDSALADDCCTDMWQSPFQDWIHSDEVESNLSKVLTMPSGIGMSSDWRTKYLWEGLHAKNYNVEEHERTARAKKVIECFDCLPSEGFFPHFIRSYLPTTDAPVWYLFGAALGVIAQIVNRKVWFNNGGRQLYSNHFTALVGISGGRKSTAANLCNRWLTEHSPYPILEADTTWASFVKHLGYEISPQEFSTFIPPNDAKGIATICLDEISAFLKNLQATYNGGMKENLTSLYDCPRSLAKRTSSQGCFIIKNPWLSIVGATSLEWFNSNLVVEDLAGGFYARWLFIVADEPAYSLMRCDPPDARHEYVAKEQLERVGRIEGEMVMTNEAERYYCQWGKKLTVSNPEIDPWVNRMRDYAIKIAMLFHLSQHDTLVMGIDSITQACMLVSKIMADSEQLISGLSRSPYQRLCNRIISILKRHDGVMTFRVMLRNLRSVPSDELKPALLSLREAGQISCPDNIKMIRGDSQIALCE